MNKYLYCECEYCLPRLIPAKSLGHVCFRGGFEYLVSGGDLRRAADYRPVDPHFGMRYAYRLASVARPRDVRDYLSVLGITLTPAERQDLRKAMRYQPCTCTGCRCTA